MPNNQTILFAGGGTGGHLFPALAVAEQLAVLDREFQTHFVCSNRAIDREILSEAEKQFTPLSVVGLSSKPWHWPGFVLKYAASQRKTRQMMRERHIACIVAMGGFVSGPVVVAAKRQGVPVVLVNLDAVPGKANRFLAGKADEVFSAYSAEQLGPNVQQVGLPLPKRSIGGRDPSSARLELGHAPDRPLLLVVGGSQGARSLNQTMLALLENGDFITRLNEWQVLHLSGTADQVELREAYKQKGVVAAVLPFCHRMGLAWSAASLAISRAGANSVAEAIANRAPTIFMPYPHHVDQHQKLNAGPLVDDGAALMFDDAADGPANAKTIAPMLIELMTNEQARHELRRRLTKHDRGNGAKAIAEAVVSRIRS